MSLTTKNRTSLPAPYIKTYGLKSFFFLNDDKKVFFVTVKSHKRLYCNTLCGLKPCCYCLLAWLNVLWFCIFCYLNLVKHNQRLLIIIKKEKSLGNVERRKEKITLNTLAILSITPWETDVMGNAIIMGILFYESFQTKWT